MKQGEGILPYQNMHRAIDHHQTTRPRPRIGQLVVIVSPTPQHNAGPYAFCLMQVTEVHDHQHQEPSCDQRPVGLHFGKREVTQS